MNHNIYSWIVSYSKNFDFYNIFLLDSIGNPLLSVDLSFPYEYEHYRDTIDEVIRTGEIVFSDLHVNSRGDIDIDIVIPLIEKNELYGLLVVEIDPHQFLFPLIQSWPTPSPSAETVLVRLEGEYVVFLNDLRHRRDTALKLKYPVDTEQLPAAMAARGAEGIVEGFDYRDVPVLADVRRIPDSPWYIITKIDQDEVHAPLRAIALHVGFSAFLLIIVAAFGTALLWRNHRAVFYRRQYELELERKGLLERFEYVTTHANDIILLCDSGRRIVEVNEKAVSTYGYSRDELLRMQVEDLRVPELRPHIEQDMAKSRESDGLVYETLHQKKDGTVFPVEVSSRHLQIGEQIHAQGIIRDITERKKAEAGIARLTRLYAFLSHVNQTIVRVRDRDGLFREICRIAVVHGGFRLAWIGMIEKETGLVIPSVSDGYDDGYLDQLVVSTGDDPFGRGPVGTAVRQAGYHVVNDIEHDSDMRPWKDEALKRGYRSSAAVSIKLKGETIGVFSLYANEPEFFGEDEIELLVEIGEDISFALDTFEVERERKHAKEARMAALERREELEAIISHSPAVVFLWKAAEGWPVEYVSENIRQFGYSPEDLLSGRLPFAGIVHPEDLPRVAGEVRRHSDGGRSFFAQEYRVMTGDGKIRWVDDRTRVRRDAAGRITHYQGIILDITERRQAEEDLREQKEIMQTILDNIPIMVSFFNPSGRLEWVNRCWEETLGWTCEESRSRDIIRDLYPDDSTCTAVMDFIRRADGVWGDFKTRLRDGTVLDTSWANAPLSDGSNIGIGQDISARKRVEEALRTSRAELALRNRIADVFLTAPDQDMFAEVLDIVLDAMDSRYGVFAYIDEDDALVAPSMTGVVWEKCNVPGKSVRFPRDTWGDSIWARSVRQQQPLFNNEPSKVPEGHLPIDRVMVVPIVFQGEVIGHFIVANKDTLYTEQDIERLQSITAYIAPVLSARLQRDLQERARLKVIEELRESAAGYRKLWKEFNAFLDAIPDRLTLHSPEMTILWANQEAGRWMKTEASDLAGRHCFTIWFGRATPCKNCPVQKSFQTGGPESDHVTASDGRILDVRTIPIKDDDGKVTSVIQMARDVSEQKSLELQLRQAQKMEAIGTLAGGIAHDFNNILGIIMGFSEIALLELPRTGLLANNIQQVLKAANRAKDLVKQILTFCRQADQELKPVQPRLIVKESFKMLRASLPSTIEMRQQIHSESLILGDPTQIQQVLMNLCANAAHAIRDKGGVLEIGLHDVELGPDSGVAYPDVLSGPFVRLSVTDTGHGIDTAIMDKIFDPFFTTKEVGEGTGMGLAVVHGIVKSHGGFIRVYSEPGQGTTFHLFFPRIEVDWAKEIPAVGSNPRGSERVLLVDDEPAIAEIARQMLERLGYETVYRTSSIEALEAFRNQSVDRPIDLVITDMTMPHLTGIELSREIRSIQPDIPIILCTGFSEMIDEKNIAGLGISELIMKPFVTRELALAVRRALEKRKPKAAP
jgi:PAS domain S-box-containing protein